MSDIRAYLRASTTEQDATRATKEIKQFTRLYKRNVDHWYTENQSGTLLERPELNRLLDEAQPGDVLLLESIDRLSRLPRSDWDTLHGRIKAAGLSVVVVDLDITHSTLDIKQDDWIASIMTDAFLQISAAYARRDYEKLSKRRAQGIAKAKEQGKYTGKRRTQATIDKYNKALKLSEGDHGLSVEDACRAATLGAATFYRLKKEFKGRPGKLDNI